MEQGRADGCRKLLHCSRKITLWGDSLWVESGNRQDCSSSLPPSLGHSLGSSWMLALPEQRGQIQQLEHPCTPSSHLPATGNRAGGWKGPWIFNKNWLLRRVFQKEPLQILSKISNLQLFLSFFLRKPFPHTPLLARFALCAPVNGNSFSCDKAVAEIHFQCRLLIATIRKLKWGQLPLAPAQLLLLFLRVDDKVHLGSAAESAAWLVFQLPRGWCSGVQDMSVPWYQQPNVCQTSCEVHLQKAPVICKVVHGGISAKDRLAFIQEVFLPKRSRHHQIVVRKCCDIWHSYHCWHFSSSCL